jgi:hypothetical protein
LEINVHREGAKTHVTVAGRISEDSDFRPLLRDIAASREVVLDMSGVTRINSSGVREWVLFIQAIPTDTRIELEKCPVAFIEQVNMIANFIGHARIKTFFVPLVCPSCEEPLEALRSVEEMEKSPSIEAKCPTCETAMEHDGDPERYLEFLRQARAGG